MRELTTRDWQLFIEALTRKRSDLSTSTRNMLMATFRNVLKVARDDGLIDVVPATPRVRQKDNPRAFFRFAPLVAQGRDEYQQLLKGAKQLAAEGRLVVGLPSQKSCMTSSSSPRILSFVPPRALTLAGREALVSLVLRPGLEAQLASRSHYPASAGNTKRAAGRERRTRE